MIDRSAVPARQPVKRLTDCEAGEVPRDVAPSASGSPRQTPIEPICVGSPHEWDESRLCRALLV